MNGPTFHAEQLRALVDVVCDGAPTEHDVAEIERLLQGNPEAQRRYLAQIRLERWLRLEFAHAGQTPNVADNSLSAPVILGAPLRETFHGFASGWPIAYLVATIIFAIGLLVGAFVHVSQPVNLVRPATPLPPLPSRLSPRTSVVARITGMVDCVWEGGQQLQSTGHYPLATNHSVTLGDRLVLRSGLLELTYDTGARVILQGPVTYELESPAGGFLSLGKLTARLDSHSEVSNLKSQISNQKSEIANHTFVIRTPTALVTDLGTEFGVEVDKNGATRSRVFTGRVRVQATASDGMPQGEGRMLHENDSVRVDRGGLSPIISVGPTNQESRFIRSFPEVKIKTLDLVDVIAGGDGFSERRNRGIDAATGDRTDALSAQPIVAGDHQYHRPASLPFVDGVFIPDGGRGPVQINSAGQTFADFGPTNNLTWGPVWAGTSCGTPAENIATKLAGVDYGASGHAVLFLHANKGITFDLDAVRRANPGWKPVRFSAVTGNSETISETARAVYADVRVLVDAQVRFQRRQISQFNGAFPIAIPISERDRFLTLAATDGGNGSSWDFIIFGDPRLELSERTVPDRPMHGEENHGQ